MEGAYLFLLIIILSGYLFTKNIGINILQCISYALFLEVVKIL